MFLLSLFAYGCQRNDTRIDRKIVSDLNGSGTGTLSLKSGKTNVYIINKQYRTSERKHTLRFRELPNVYVSNIDESKGL